MALKSVITLPSGVMLTDGYVQVVNVVWRKPQPVRPTSLPAGVQPEVTPATQVQVAIYKDAAARQSNKPIVTTQTYSIDLAENGDVATIYTALKKLPIFKDAVDC